MRKERTARWKLALALTVDVVVTAATFGLIARLAGGQNAGLVAAVVAGVLSVPGFFLLRSVIGSRRNSQQAKDAWMRKRAEAPGDKDDS